MRCYNFWKMWKYASGRGAERSIPFQMIKKFKQNQTFIPYFDRIINKCFNFVSGRYEKERESEKEYGPMRVNFFW